MTGNCSQNERTGTLAVDTHTARSQSTNRSADRDPSAGSDATLVQPMRWIAKLGPWACGALMAMFLCARILIPQRPTKSARPATMLVRSERECRWICQQHSDSTPGWGGS